MAWEKEIEWTFQRYGSGKRTAGGWSFEKSAELLQELVDSTRPFFSETSFKRTMFFKRIAQRLYETMDIRHPSVRDYYGQWFEDWDLWRSA